MFHPEWRMLFPQNVWQQGLDCYRCGHVLEIRHDENEVTALVQGSKLHVVSVLFDPESDQIEDFICDCPYGKAETPCAHLAAVLCALEEEDKAESEKVPEIEEAVDLLSEAQMRDLLLHFAKRDAYVCEKIQLTATRRLPESQREQWEADLEELTAAAQDRHGFVNYENASSYCLSLSGYLEERSHDLISAGLCKEAFDLTCMVFETAVNQAIDDDGDLAMLFGDCKAVWSEILQHADLPTQREMLRWFEAHYNDEDVGEWFIQEYIFDVPWDTRLAPQILKRLDEEIEEWKQSTSDPYPLNGPVVRKLQWLERSGADQGEIERFIAEYRHLSSVRELLIDRALERGDDQEALVLLETGKVFEEGHAQLVESYSRREIGIYTRRSMERELRSELEFYLFTFSQHDLSYVDQLKAMLTSEEWETMRERLLNSPTMTAWRKMLLAQEELYDRLMDEIEADTDIRGLDQYELLLRNRFPQRCIHVLTTYLRPAMDRATNRKAYWSAVQILKKLRRYSEAEAKAMAAEWKVKYPRRTAMLDELEMAGF